jgi:hypothetical protein
MHLQTPKRPFATPPRPTCYDTPRAAARHHLAKLTSTSRASTVRAATSALTGLSYPGCAASGGARARGMRQHEALALVAGGQQHARLPDGHAHAHCVHLRTRPPSQPPAFDVSPPRRTRPLPSPDAGQSAIGSCSLLWRMWGLLAKAQCLAAMQPRTHVWSPSGWVRRPGAGQRRASFFTYIMVS